MAFRLGFPHYFPETAAILVYLVVAGVQDIFAAHAAWVHFTLFQGGTILVPRAGFVGIALWYQLVADNTSVPTMYGGVLGVYCR